MDPIASISNAIKLVSTSIELSKKLNHVELRSELVTVKEQLLDVREGIIEVRQENIGLKDLVQSLRDEIAKLNQPPEMILRNGLYVIEGQDAEYCVACFVDRGKKIPVGDPPVLHRSICRKRCPSCKANYQ